ncbi:hypothetical protein O181_025486 [Austropuccinia psidii MF-1]|uniref:Uncharacterized protein n=1 Tax=Austropuccinia psidii MF-1 TaxID=1389203 RepID=A0A9Q3GZL2_9BASI|nr:hypothetical protein [Austropuccinia psidii MF-1]
MLQEYYSIPDELISARLHSLFEKSEKIWYHGIRQTNGKDTWSGWKQEIITKWNNDAWRYKIENAFENSLFDPDKDKPLTWFLKQVERLNALYQEMSQKMVHMKMLKKCGGELEHALRSRFIEPCSTEEYINALEEIVTRTKIGRPWKKLDIKSPNKPFIKKDKPRETFKPNTSNSNEPRKYHKCGEETDSEKDTEESETSESDEFNIINAQINSIDLIYEVLDVNSNLPPVGTSDTRLTNIQDAKLYRTKPAKGMGYTAGKSSISIVMVENQESKVNLDTGAYFTCVDISNQKDIYLAIGDNKRQNFGFFNNKKQIKVIKNKEKCPEKDLFIAEQLKEEEFNHTLTEKMKEKLIDLLFKYKNAFATDKEPLGAIIGHEVDIILNVENPYPPLLRRPFYPASPRAREALEVHINELIDLGVLRKLGQNEQVEVTKPGIM